MQAFPPCRKTTHETTDALMEDPGDTRALTLSI